MAKLSIDPTTSPQRSSSITTSHPLTPLQEATADRVNRKLSRQDDATSALADGEDAENAKPGHLPKSIRLTATEAQEIMDRRKYYKLALERSQLAREEAESETKQFREAVTQLQKSVEEGRAREMRLNERWENVVEELDAVNERHKYAISRYEKEVRKFAKQQFQVSSHLVKVQEELKATRTAFKSAQTENNAYRAKESSAKDDEFRAQYKLISLQEEYDKLQGKYEKAQKRLRQSSAFVGGFADAEQGAVWDPLDEEEQEATKTSVLRYNLHLAQEAMKRSEETVEFMKMECRFRCCPCRIEEELAEEKLEPELPPLETHDDEIIGSPTKRPSPRGRSRVRRSSASELPALRTRSPSAPYKTAPSSIIGSDADSSQLQEDSIVPSPSVDLDQDPTPEPLDLPPIESPTKTAFFNEEMTMIVPPSGMIFKSKTGQIPTADDFAQILAQATKNVLPSSPSELDRSEIPATPVRLPTRPLPIPPPRLPTTNLVDFADEPAPLTGDSDTPLCSPPAALATPYQTIERTQTVSIPLKPADDSSPSLQVAATPAKLSNRPVDPEQRKAVLLPGTPISREAALAQIEARRGRARSAHATGTPAKPTQTAATASARKRDISAPEKSKTKTSTNSHTANARSNGRRIGT